MKYLREYKRNFTFESYIDTLNYENRKIIAKLRLSNHNFPIEKLRYEGVEMESRVCNICNLEEVGDESHYTMRCQHAEVKRMREIFLNDALESIPELNTFENIDIIKYALTMADHSLHFSTAEFIKGIFKAYDLAQDDAMDIIFKEIFI